MNFWPFCYATIMVVFLCHCSGVWVLLCYWSVIVVLGCYCGVQWCVSRWSGVNVTQNNMGSRAIFFFCENVFFISSSQSAISTVAFSHYRVCQFYNTMYNCTQQTISSFNPIIIQISFLANNNYPPSTSSSSAASSSSSSLS